MRFRKVGFLHGPRYRRSCQHPGARLRRKACFPTPPKPWPHVTQLANGIFRVLLTRILRKIFASPTISLSERVRKSPQARVSAAISLEKLQTASALISVRDSRSFGQLLQNPRQRGARATARDFFLQSDTKLAKWNTKEDRSKRTRWRKL